MSMRLAIWTRFNMPMPRHGDIYRDPAWVKSRLLLYRNWTLPSLRNQSFQDFDILLQCAPDTARLLYEFGGDLPSLGVTLVFDGGREYYRTLPDDVDQVAFLRIDSDDMYASGAVQAAHDALPERLLLRLLSVLGAAGIVEIDLEHAPPSLLEDE